MEWRSEPRQWQALPDGMQLTTDAGTDFWRHTHYGFVRDDGHFRFETVHRDFELEVTIAGDYRDQYDQAGLMVRTDDAQWIKCGIEFVDARELVPWLPTGYQTGRWHPGLKQLVVLPCGSHLNGRSMSSRSRTAPRTIRRCCAWRHSRWAPPKQGSWPPARKAAGSKSRSPAMRSGNGKDSGSHRHPTVHGDSAGKPARRGVGCGAAAEPWRRAEWQARLVAVPQLAPAPVILTSACRSARSCTRIGGLRSQCRCGRVARSVSARSLDRSIAGKRKYRDARRAGFRRATRSES